MKCVKGESVRGKGHPKRGREATEFVERKKKNHWAPKANRASIGWVHFLYT